MAKKKSDTSETPAPSPATASVEATPAPTPTAETSAPAAAGTETESNKRRGRQPGISPRRGKKLRALLKNQQSKIAKTGPLPLKEALKLVKSLKRAKFDETIEVHMHLGIDPTQADQMIRGSIPLPFGLGKEKKVLVFCQGENLAKAKEAGADFVGGDDLIKKIQSENWMDFDVALATQDMMGMVSRLGKVLGPRGLMPTPKAGTVIPTGGDVAQAVREFKAGKVEYRSDKGGNVHAGLGKISFDDEKLIANITAFVDTIRAVKPSGVKGNYVNSITIKSTMSPGVPVSM
ncbi:MAG: 50S ribosomal protein L1 [Gemmataceae bacterium]